MRILFINPVAAYIRGGAEVNDLKLGMAFQDLGHDVCHVHAWDPKTPAANFPPGHQTHKIQMPYFYDHALALPGVLGKAARGGFFHLFLRQLLKSGHQRLNSADLILITGRPLLSKLKSATPATVFLSIRGHNASRHWGHYKKADGILYWGGCETDHPGEIVQATPHLNLNPAIEKDIFYPPVEPQKNKSAIKILYAGRLDPVHQVDTILRAAAFCRSQNMPLQLHIIGDGTERGKLERQAKNLALRDIIFHGLISRKDLANQYRSADILIINPKHTNHPITVKEAIACGVYVIAPKLGRIENILNHTHFGTLFQPNNQNALNMALLDTLKKQTYKNKPSNTSGVYFDTWEKNARRILDFYTPLSQQAAA